MLIILSGLPGAGKTALAQALARLAGAVHLRIDTIEQALKSAGRIDDDMEDGGYRVAYALATDNLRLGLSVIADSVNGIELTRAAWREAAWLAGKPYLDVHVICSDSELHRRRLEGRLRDIEGLNEPTWAEVEAREFEPWDADCLTVDTATESAEALAAKIVAKLCLIGATSS